MSAHNPLLKEETVKLEFVISSPKEVRSYGRKGLMCDEGDAVAQKQKHSGHGGRLYSGGGFLLKQ